MSATKLKKGDTVRVIAGKNKDSEGKIISIDREKNRVVIEGVNMVTKHVKPKRQGEAGGRIEQEGTIDASNVMLVCPKCGKATRVAHQVVDGKKVRVCKKCGKVMD